MSAKVLRKCSVSSLILLWQVATGNQSQRSLLYLARFSRYKHFCVLQFLQKIQNGCYIWRDKNILKIGMGTPQRYPAGQKFC